MQYAKPVLSVAALVSRLQAKGLQVLNPVAAEQTLQRIGYFRFRGFALPFTVLAPPGLPHGTRRFVPGTTFEQICEIYDFDRALRVILLKYLERIEVAARAAIIDVLNNQFGCHWYSDFNQPIFTRRDDHSKWFGEVCRELQRSHEPFVKHYFDTYTMPTFPPSWAMAECLSFGKWSHLYEQVGHGKAAIASAFGLSAPVLQSWLHSLSYIRNVCAHHSRIHKKALRFPPKPHPQYVNEFAGPPTSFYSRAVVIQIFISTIDDKSLFRDDLRYLEYGFGSTGTQLLTDLGFPAHWTARPVWQ